MASNIFAKETVERESTIEKNSRLAAKKVGWTSFKFVSPGHSGVPDQIYIKNGTVVFIEYKTSKGVTSKLQKKCIQQLNDLNCWVFIARSVEETLSALRTVEQIEAEA